MFTFKNCFSGFLFIVLFNQLPAQNLCPIIPAVLSADRVEASFTLGNELSIYTSRQALLPVARYLQYQLLKHHALSLSVERDGGQGSIKLIQNGNKEDDESYILEIKKGEVRISGSSAGVFNGVVSFLQLVREGKKTNTGYVLDGWKIKDSPKYKWRGFMLDESRHFFGKEKVKDILDWMAFYKLNRLHWHLTDEPAWRLEILKYPRLSVIGGIGNFLDELAPAKYYTQADIREIVEYAAERNITVIPEIDMPGHATAANKAYPEFTGGGSAGHPDFTFDPGKEKAYSYLSNILRETNVLFPSGMIHLGGDEVSFGNEKWKDNQGIQQLMREKGLADLQGVEKYFIRRMADTLFKLKSKVLLWDEMAGTDLPKDKTIIFWWRHDKQGQLKLALDNGYETVLCPRLPLYFDFVQDSTHTYGRKWGGKYNPLESVYAFNPPVEFNKQILGVQANLWTETVQSPLRLDYLLFPRIAALAEAAWTQNRNYADFTNRLKPHLELYREAGLYYCDPFSPAKTPEPGKIGSGQKKFKTEL